MVMYQRKLGFFPRIMPHSNSLKTLIKEKLVFNDRIDGIVFGIINSNMYEICDEMPKGRENVITSYKKRRYKKHLHLCL